MVDHQFVALSRNWTRGRAPLARGRRGESGGGGGWTIRSPAGRRRAALRRRVAELGGSAAQRGEKEGGGACEHRELTSELGERSGRPENERVAGIVPGGGGRG